MRLAVLFDHLGPYHRARLVAAARQSELLAVESRALSSEYAWEPLADDAPYTHATLSAEPSKQSPGRKGPTARSLAKVLDMFSPACVAVPGWSDPIALLAISWSLRTRTPFVLMSESSAHDEARVFWREHVKSRIARLASAALVGGRSHAAYLESLGMPSDRIFLGYDAVDNAHFESGAAEWRRSGEKLPPYFLASARFVAKKNLSHLLDSYALYRQKAGGSPWPLVLLGDGELKADLLAHAVALGLEVVASAPWETGGTNSRQASADAPAAVWLPGFRQIAELPRFYAGAGAFVHASTTEQWGLVVNEAMASGLPVLVSERCGCAPELVREGENGWTFDPHDLEALADLMSRVTALSVEERTEMGEASRRLVAAWGPQRFAEGLEAAAAKAMEVGPRRAGLVDRALLELLARR